MCQNIKYFLSDVQIFGWSFFQLLCIAQALRGQPSQLCAHAKAHWGLPGPHRIQGYLIYNFFFFNSFACDHSWMKLKFVFSKAKVKIHPSN
jgi:hypothetical protein